MNEFAAIVPDFIDNLAPRKSNQNWSVFVKRSVRIIRAVRVHRVVFWEAGRSEAPLLTLVENCFPSFIRVQPLRKGVPPRTRPVVWFAVVKSGKRKDCPRRGESETQKKRTAKHQWNPGKRFNCGVSLCVVCFLCAIRISASSDKRREIGKFHYGFYWTDRLHCLRRMGESIMSVERWKGFALFPAYSLRRTASVCNVCACLCFLVYGLYL